MAPLAPLRPDAIQAEAIGFRGATTVLMPLSDLRGVLPLSVLEAGTGALAVEGES